MANTMSSFLGGNTPCGFVSFFDELYNPYEKHRALIIKGGPGTGKSGIMKTVAKKAEEKGYSTEYIYCASDPKSLDGVIIPELKLAIADGTSPHVIEPVFPGAAEKIINTGDCWDDQKLFSKGDEIRRLTLENSLHHRRSSAYLSAAGKLKEENSRAIDPFINREKIYSYALRFVNRELPEISKTPGRKKRRFLSAITPEGKVFLSDSVKKQAHRIIGVEDEFSDCAALLIDRIGELAVKRGYDVYFCYCPMSPKGECEHIIIPSASLALISEKSTHNTNLEYDRVLHSRRFLYEGTEKHKKRLSLNRRLQNELLNESIECLKKAKQVHDDLEKIYIDAMDFDTLGKTAQKIINDFVGS